VNVVPHCTVQTLINVSNNKNSDGPKKMVVVVRALCGSGCC
jgi:hypothetical protein